MAVVARSLALMLLSRSLSASSHTRVIAARVKNGRLRAERGGPPQKQNRKVSARTKEQPSLDDGSVHVFICNVPRAYSLLSYTYLTNSSIFPLWCPLSLQCTVGKV